MSRLPPSEIHVLADYGCSPLWFVAGDQIENIDPAEAGLSTELAAAFDQWAAAYDNGLNLEAPRESRFKSARDADNFFEQGLALSQRLASEVAGVRVRYSSAERGTFEDVGPSE